MRGQYSIVFEKEGNRTEFSGVHAEPHKKST